MIEQEDAFDKQSSSKAKTVKEPVRLLLTRPLNKLVIARVGADRRESCPLGDQYSSTDRNQFLRLLCTFIGLAWYIV